MTVGFFAKKKIIPFLGNHYRHLAAQVNDLQKKQEMSDAEKFRNSVAALTSRPTLRPVPHYSFFTAPKPKPNASKKAKKALEKSLAVKPTTNLLVFKP